MRILLLVASVACAALFLLLLDGGSAPIEPSDAAWNPQREVALGVHHRLRGAGWMRAEDEQYAILDARHLALFVRANDPKTESWIRQAITSVGAADDLPIIVVTPSIDHEAIRESVPQTLPTCYGALSSTLETYDVDQLPSLRLVAADGTTQARDLISLRAQFLER